jgi:4-carboxymuconolactone decarboxylase
VSRKQGVTEQQLRELGDFETSTAFNELEKLVLRYATAMTQTPVEVPDELFNALRQRLNPRQMVELTSAIAWENYRTRFDHAFGIEAEGFSAGAFCPLPHAQGRTDAVHHLQESGAPS